MKFNFKKTFFLGSVVLTSLLVTACQQDSFIRQRAEGQDIVFEVNIAGNMVEAFRIESDATGSKLNNSVEDKDMSLCVNDGGVEKCLTVDGPTANVVVPGSLTVTGEADGTLKLGIGETAYAPVDADFQFVGSHGVFQTSGSEMRLGIFSADGGIRRIDFCDYDSPISGGGTCSGIDSFQYNDTDSEFMLRENQQDVVAFSDANGIVTQDKPINSRAAGTFLASVGAGATSEPSIDTMATGEGILVMCYTTNSASTTKCLAQCTSDASNDATCLSILNAGCTVLISSGLVKVRNDGSSTRTMKCNYTKFF